MIKETTSTGELQYFVIPFRTGTTQLTIDVLNQHSEFRFIERPYLVIRKRTISFHNEVLTLGICLGEEKEELVYIRVWQTGLRISCSVDTDYTYLSRYAYFAIYSFISGRGLYDFGKYYWPDFFSPKTGKSKYLTIMIDRLGIKIKRKDNYAFFYKPGYKLIYPFKDKTINAAATPKLEKESVSHFNPFAIGYCLADHSLNPSYSSHFPFLVCYTARWKKNQQDIEGFNSFLLSPDQIQAYDYTSMQKKINLLSRKMLALAPVKLPPAQSTLKEVQAVKRENIRTMKEIHGLWQKAIPFLQTQPYTHYHYTFGLRHVKGKPRKKDMKPCTFSTESPQLYFLLVSKGEYYELEMRFKADGKVYLPNRCNPTFFIHSTTEPYHLYLLDSITDYHVVCFFVRHDFKLSVLKCHFKGAFQAFIGRIAAAYELSTRLKFERNEKE